MKILIISNHFYPDLKGGAERSVYNYCKALMESDEISKVCVLTLSDYFKYEVIDGIEVYRIKKKYKLNYERSNNLHNLFYYIEDNMFNLYQKDIKAVIDNFYPDIIHTQNIDGMGNVWKTCKENNIKIIHTIRDDYLSPNDLFPCEDKYSLKHTIRRFINYALKYKRCSNLEKVDYVTTISDFYKDKYENALNQRVYSIPNFFLDSEIEKLKTISNIKNSVYTFGFIGRISEEKGVLILIKAFVELSSKNECKLIIAGKINSVFAQSLVDRYASDNIVFLGECNPDDFYCKVDTVVIPSLWEEAFGRVAIEAVVCGKNIIVSDSGALNQVLTKVNASFDLYPRFSGYELERKMLLHLNYDKKNKCVDISPYRKINVISIYIELYNK